MKLWKRASLLTLALGLVLGLTACGESGPDMPMEMELDGHTIVLGETTTGDMASWGWEVNLTGTQNEIQKNAKYVACYYDVRKEDGSGNQFWVSVYVPFQKNISGDYVDFSKEEKESKTNGVVYRISVRKDSSENYDIVYNGMDYQDLTWEDAEGWGAVKDEDAYPTTYELKAAQGTLEFEKGYTGKDEPGKLTVTMSQNAFSKLQK